MPENLNKQSPDNGVPAQPESTDAGEDRWRCRCGSENAGSLTYCPICGRTRGEAEKDPGDSL